MRKLRSEIKSDRLRNSTFGPYPAHETYVENKNTFGDWKGLGLGLRLGEQS